MRRIIAQAFLTEGRVNTLECDEETTMKRLIPVLLFAAIAQSAFAGMTYKVETVSTGLHDGGMSGTIEVEGKNFRFNVAQGDGVMFPDSSFMVSTDAGRTLSIVDPSAKTYFDIAIDQMAGNIGAMLGGKVQVSNPKVNVRDLGPGEKIEGFATQKTTMNVSGIAKKSIAASEFVIPADFKKSESPMDKMKQTLGGGAPKQ